MTAEDDIKALTYDVNPIVREEGNSKEEKMKLVVT